MQVEVTRGVIFGMETWGEEVMTRRWNLLITVLVSVSALAA